METKQIEQEVAPVLARAQAIAVRDQVEYLSATAFVKEIKAAHKRASEFFAPVVEAAHLAHKQATAARDKILKPLKQAEEEINRVCMVWYRAEEDKRQEQQRILQYEAEQKAKQEQDRLLKLAASRKTEAKQEEYRAAAAAVVVPVVSVASTVAPVTGRAVVKRWTFEITDESKIPREFLMVDESKLGKYAVAMKDSADVAGVRFYQVEQFSTRV
jgi:hypothetical protein